MDRLTADFVQLFNFLALMPNLYFWEGDCTLGYAYAQVLDFPKIS